MNKKTPSTFEPHYKPLLVRDEAKEALQKLRGELPERDLLQERRLATAIVELGLEAANTDIAFRNRIVTKAMEIVVRDINSKNTINQ